MSYPQLLLSKRKLWEHWGNILTGKDHRRRVGAVPPQVARATLPHSLLLSVVLHLAYFIHLHPLPHLMSI